MPDVTIVDTSPRDGQVALPSIDTKGKIALANSLIQSGLTKIDCVGFTHPRIRPEFADAEKVISAVAKKPGIVTLGIAPNEVACRRALATDIDEIGTLISSSESFTRSVLGISIREPLYKTFPAIFQACREKNKGIRVYILSAFSCQYEGRIPLNDIVDLACKLSFMGADEISLVDTPGQANPAQVKNTIQALLGQNLKSRIAVHFHNTRGLGLVNCLAAYEAGVRIFDTAIGGLSGTPFGAPAMQAGSWNVPTEDLVYLFHEMGVNTAINHDALLDSVKLAQKLVGRELFGHALNASTAFKSSNFPEPLTLN